MTNFKISSLPLVLANFIVNSDNSGSFLWELIEINKNIVLNEGITIKNNSVGPLTVKFGDTDQATVIGTTSINIYTKSIENLTFELIESEEISVSVYGK
jgi:hypothetical protein